MVPQKDTTTVTRVKLFKELTQLSKRRVNLLSAVGFYDVELLGATLVPLEAQGLMEKRPMRLYVRTALFLRFFYLHSQLLFFLRTFVAQFSSVDKG